MGKRWFSRRDKGIGWKPATWHGWFIIYAYIASLVISFIWVFNRTATIHDFLFNFIVQLLILTIILSFICYFTGEKPRT